MSRSLLIAALVGTFILGSAIKDAHTSPTTSDPRIVAKIHVQKQTQGIPTTTLFTPTVTGLFRVSSYITVTSSGDDSSQWFLNWNWVDDAGVESNTLAVVQENVSPPIAYEGSGSAFVFEAVAGQPVSFSWQQPPNSQATYSLALVVERLF